MNEQLFYLCLIIAAILVTVGIVLLTNNKMVKRSTGKSSLVKLIIGWSLIGLTIIGTIIAILLYIHETSGTLGIVVVMVLCPIGVCAGFVAMLSNGISLFNEGLNKDIEGKRNKEKIVGGSFLMFLSIAVVTTIIVSFVILLQMHSSADHPVAFM